jgi:hypothetical protein
MHGAHLFSPSPASVTLRHGQIGYPLCVSHAQASYSPITHEWTQQHLDLSTPADLDDLGSIHWHMQVTWADCARAAEGFVPGQPVCGPLYPHLEPKLCRSCRGVLTTQCVCVPLYLQLTPFHNSNLPIDPLGTAHSATWEYLEEDQRKQSMRLHPMHYPAKRFLQKTSVHPVGVQVVLLQMTCTDAFGLPYDLCHQPSSLPRTKSGVKRCVLATF